MIYIFILLSTLQVRANVRFHKASTWWVIFIIFNRFKVRTAEYDEIQETLEEIAKENSLLKEKAKQADVLTEVLQELVGETE